MSTFKNEKEMEDYWNKNAQDVLLNKKIVKVRYLTKEEAKEIGWDSRPVYFELEDGTYCFCSMDDEGNNGGALFYNKDGVLPVL